MPTYFCGMRCFGDEKRGKKRELLTVRVVLSQSVGRGDSLSCLPTHCCEELGVLGEKLQTFVL